MPFTPETLLPPLLEIPDVRRLRVAFSGGLDSMVLLTALQRLRESGALLAALDAIHIHHGLSPYADEWAQHCAQVCCELRVPLVQFNVVVDTESGKGIEASARNARYSALARETEPGDCLLMAHHADDQAETLLLQLLRGSGPHGLAAMPFLRPFGNGLLVRPLLDFRRDQLFSWASQAGLCWVEDHSNRQQDLDRNFLRLSVIPLLKQRWPSLATTLSRSARLCGESAQLLEELAASDIAAASTPHPRELRWKVLADHSVVRRRNLLRAWIARCGFPVPNARRLERMATDFWDAAPDRNPALRWEGAEMHRYREMLYLMPTLPAVDPALRLSWDPELPLELPGGGRLGAQRRPGEGLSVSKLLSGPLIVRFRQGGEHCHPAGRRDSHSLKKLLQEHAVPPWLRDRIPLIYHGEELIAVADRIISEGFAASPDECGWVLKWRPTND